MRVPVGPPANPVAITGSPERLQRPGHVHALAARHRGLLDGAVTAAEPEVGDGQRLVDRGVECDGDDHSICPSARALARFRALLRSARWRSLRRDRWRTATITMTQTTTQRQHEDDRTPPSACAIRRSGPAPGTSPGDQRHPVDHLALAQHGDGARRGGRPESRRARPGHRRACGPSGPGGPARAGRCAAPAACARRGTRRAAEATGSSASSTLRRSNCFRPYCSIASEVASRAASPAVPMTTLITRAPAAFEAAPTST